MVRTIEVTEYSSSSPIKLTEASLALLQSLPTDRIQALPATPSGWFVLRASSYVGTVDLGDLRVRISPKVDDLRNVLMMFASAAGVADWSPRSSYYSESELVTGVAELVLRTIDEATRRGLLHGYRTIEERLSVMRGRMLVDELARRPWNVWPVPCRYDDFTGDVSENIVLLAVVQLVRRWSPEPEIQRLANELQSRFVGVSRSGNPLLELELIRETPLNEHYRPALNLARLVLEGIAVAHVAGSFEAAAFLVDMNYLYERWIGHELRQRLWPTMLVSEQELLPLSRKPTVRMNPDLMFRVGGSVSLVGDIKYKLTGSGMARNSDYYQLLAYATAAGLESGVLIYCQADEAPARTITVENSGRQLTCYPLSLAGDWNQVTSEVENLVRTVRILAGQAIATF